MKDTGIPDEAFFATAALWLMKTAEVRKGSTKSTRLSSYYRLVRASIPKSQFEFPAPSRQQRKGPPLTLAGADKKYRNEGA